MSAQYPKVLYLTFIILAFSGPLLSYVAYRSIVPLCAISALGSIISLGPDRILKRMNNLRLSGKLITALMFSWFIGATVWAPDSARGLLSVIKLIGTCFVIFFLISGATYLTKVETKTILKSLGISTMIVVLLLLSDLITEGFFSMFFFSRKFLDIYGFFWFKPTITLVTLATLVLSFSYWIRGDKLAALIFALSIFIIVSFLNSRTLTVALPLSFLAAVLLSFLDKTRTKFLVFALACSTFLIVANIGNTFTAKDFSSMFPETKETTLSVVKRSAILSIVHRLYIWEFSSEKIRQKPLLGWGLGASRHLGNKEVMIDPKRDIWGELLPLHSHNFSLQIWIETGLIGLLLVLTFFYIILSKIDHTLNIGFFERVFFYTIILITIALWYFNYGAWTSWWLHQIGFISAMMVVCLKSKID